MKLHSAIWLEGGEEKEEKACRREETPTVRKENAMSEVDVISWFSEGCLKRRSVDLKSMSKRLREEGSQVGGGRIEEDVTTRNEKRGRFGLKNPANTGKEEIGAGANSLVRHISVLPPEATKKERRETR